MKLECGPAYDRRILDIELPKESKRIGVFVSGGIDSALLYYLLMKLNKESGSTHDIVHFSVLRREGSQYFARPVINYVNSLFGKPRQGLNAVGDPSLQEDAQVASGVIEVLVENVVDIVYVGVIEALDIHTIGWEPIVTTETDNFKTPFSKLNKSHITDLIYQLGQEHLFTITHSCIKPLERCGCCNGCNERTWGFEQLNKQDPGKF